MIEYFLSLGTNHYFEINLGKESSPLMLTKVFNFSSADYTPDGKQIIYFLAM
jgi:hypothetical protein